MSDSPVPSSTAPSPKPAEVPPAVEAPSAPGQPSVPHQVAAFFWERGLGPRTLGALALALAGLSGAFFVLTHPGLAGVLGLLALLSSELSLVPTADREAPEALPRALRLPVDLLPPAGLVAGWAGQTAGVLILLSLIVLLLFAWLPPLGALAWPGRAPSAAGLWRRPERVGVFLLGALLGRLVPGLLIVAIVSGLDTWHRLDRIARPPGQPTALPSFLRPLLQDDGDLVPAVRWGSLLLAVLLLLVLPVAEGWRF